MKRLMDVVASAAGLAVLSPLLAIIALLIKLDSRGPVFFRQQRVGRGGKPFRIYKFRTMAAHGPGSGPELTLRDDPRVTRVGTFLRHYKLDELTQLINVLVGDMSLVGPRPEVPRYVDKWDDSTRRIVLSVRPGITDMASIQFRDESALLAAADDAERKYVEEIAPAKNRLAVSYVQHRSIWLDIRIIWMTAAAIFRKPAKAIRPLEP